MKKPAILKKKRILKALGYDMEHWVRVVQNREMFSYLNKLDVLKLDALEISGNDSIWSKTVGFRSYTMLCFPEYDVCAGPAEGRFFDVIIADHVLPHVAWPLRMVKNAKAMLRPDGHLLISSSFLIHVNDRPIDCYLEECLR